MGQSLINTALKVNDLNCILVVLWTLYQLRPSRRAIKEADVDKRLLIVTKLFLFSSTQARKITIASKDFTII